MRRAVRALRLIAVALLVIALARPQTGRKLTQVSSEGIDIMLVDRHLGQHAGARLRHRAADPAPPQSPRGGEGRGAGVRRRPRPTTTIGLVVFGERRLHAVPAHARPSGCSSTSSSASRSASPDDAHRDRLRARHRGQAAAASRRPSRKVVVLLTDGRNNAGTLAPLTARRGRASLGVKVYTIGAGTRGQAPFLVDTMFGDGSVYESVDIDEDDAARDRGVDRRRVLPRRGQRGLREIYDEIDRSRRPRSRPSRTSSTTTATRGSCCPRSPAGGRGRAPGHPAEEAAMTGRAPRPLAAGRRPRLAPGAGYGGAATARCSPAAIAHRRAEAPVAAVAAAGARGVLPVELRARALARLRRFASPAMLERLTCGREAAPRHHQGDPGDDRRRRAGLLALAGLQVRLHLGGGPAPRRRHRDRARRLRQHAGRGRRAGRADRASSAPSARSPTCCEMMAGDRVGPRRLRRHRLRRVPADPRLRRRRALPRRPRHRPHPGAGHRPRRRRSTPRSSRFRRRRQARARAPSPDHRRRGPLGARGRGGASGASPRRAHLHDRHRPRRGRPSRRRAAASGATRAARSSSAGSTSRRCSRSRSTTGGRYVRSVTGDVDLEQIYVQGHQGHARGAGARTRMRRQRWEDRFQWLLGWRSPR